MQDTIQLCHHCGDTCSDETIQKDNKYFCCSGCLFVHELLRDNDLNNYYDLAQKSGIKPKTFGKKEFEFLDDVDVKEKLLSFSVNGTSKVILFIPEVYCSACIWLLENLFRLNKGILESTVNFLKKEITVTFRENATSIREIVELLTSIGYKPKLNISDIEGKKQSNPNKSLYLKVGVAGFAFGNIMLLAFPEYLSGGLLEDSFRKYFGYLSLLLSVAVLYASTDYLVSAWTSLKLKYINIDVPLSLGILTLWIRSIIDISFGLGPGYVDSMAGLVFLLLTGKVFRQKTFHSLSFERDFKSYFPMSVLKKSNNFEDYVSLNQIKPGDTLIIRNNEIIPTDSILLSDSTLIDYSFVSGESKPITLNKNEKIYAGGIHLGSSIEIIASKVFKQSYITELWNHSAFTKVDTGKTKNISNTAGKYFTIVIILIALATFLFWLPKNFSIALDSFTAVLIIACPCAFSLALPFTYGTALRTFSNNSFFLKNDAIVEKLTKVNTVIFDKTGTLTDISKSKINYFGKELSYLQKQIIKATSKHSTHPISRLILNHFSDISDIEIKDFEEIIGKGIEARLDNIAIKIGKKEFVDSIFSNNDTHEKSVNQQTESSVYISVDGENIGSFVVEPYYRNNISDTLKQLITKYKIIILSGDNDSEKDKIISITNPETEIVFNQKPIQKLNFVENLQKGHKNVMMIGDGLNDSGALKQSDIGVAVTDSASNFTPGSDAILLADKLDKLSDFILLAKKSVQTVYVSFFISVFYNIIGLIFAVQGILSPFIAAIFMPVSSISIMLFAVLSIKYFANKYKLNQL